MDDKENANQCTWNQAEPSILEKSIASPQALKSPAILKQNSLATNCSSLTNTEVISEVKPAETKNVRMSFSQNFLLKRSTKEKQLKIATHNSGVRLPEKRVLGSYRGKVISSKINSFRKRAGNENSKNTLEAPTKPAMSTGLASNNTRLRDVTTNNTVSASKPVVIVSLQTRPPVRVPVSHPKSIMNPEKQSTSKVAVQKKPDRNWKPLLKTVTYNANNSVPRTKKTLPPKTVTGTLAQPISETYSIMSASESVNKRSTVPDSAEVRRSQLAEWQACKGKGAKKVPAPLSADSQPVKEPVESFWAAIAEEDEQELFSNAVNKTLKKCLCLIETGYSGDNIQSTLEGLIHSVPDAKKLAKYWVCRMRLEQVNSTEKIIAIYEEAVLAGAQPKDELRRVLADVMKNTKSLPKPTEESMKKEIALNDTAETNLEEEMVANSLKEVHMNKTESCNEETCPKAAAAVCLTSEPESFPNESKDKNKEHHKPIACVKEQKASDDAKRDGILECKTPENDKEGSYLIKYNVSTTPYLESMKKKLQCEASDSAVKDLKFLTPVRRSRRLQGKVCKLPNMLKDHNPCVSSLEQLGELGDENNAFIYRQNNALQKVGTRLEGQGKE
ncbi:cytoskeleton-associated protein 2 [Hemicordylus capensis]|uniref:cytoskeleton-associated protein 2 n=1 Tax=Hemicordylus capensis TaxID=884348 RepID=UPI00230369D0|nr:cytoskeleton-associated protein 2 [Hemicordylus capensis]XP_053141042.1 cytoskeleton-associated protein 2 [Hemicordylus capensis]XP_053141043.1 cytoskeleton-associated protein 2 [Hemicordylus capensis]XP_053141044.1 cytoskeleton-associated protein 2 [Hemicordylus capensis]